MPFYEGIGLISEKHPVVIEIGHAFTRAGFAGESSPRCVIPSAIKSRRLAEYKDENDLYQMFVDFFQHLYFKYLLVTPKDRRVVIVESLFTKTEWRQSLARVLYLHYEVLNILWIPDHLAACISTSTGLILDIGHEEAFIIPVYNGITLLNSIQVHELGAKMFDMNLKNLMKSNCLTLNEKDIEPLLTDHVISDVRTKACFVTTAERANLIEKNPDQLEPKLKPFNIELDGKFHKFNGIVREKGPEIWFNNNDLDGISLPRMILSALEKCPIDTRVTLASSIIVCGGALMIPGFKRRLLQDLKILTNRSDVSKYEFSIYDTLVRENCVSWFGGSIYGATEALNLRGISKEYFLKNGNIPDWCNSISNISTNHHLFSATSTPTKSL